MVSCCLSATGIRFSVILFPPGSWALLTVGLPDPSGRTPTGFPRSARTSCDRGGRPLYPGDDGAHPDRGDSRPAPAASQRPVPAPRQHPIRRGSRLTRHQRGFKQFARPVFPSPVAARMERAALGLDPRASHPADQEPDDARRGGDRPSSTDLELPLNSHPSISNPVVHSMCATSRRTWQRACPSQLGCQDECDRQAGRVIWTEGT